MSRSPLFSRIRRAFAKARDIVEGDERVVDRRAFLRQAAVAAGAVFLGGTSGLAAPRTAPRIAVLGAGLAGLNAARWLLRGGVPCTVYEGARRIGGRLLTVHDAFGAGTWTELGAEFINPEHVDLLALAKELRLELLDAKSPSEAKLNETWFFDGRALSDEDVVKAFVPIAGRIQKDVDRLPRVINHQTRDERVVALDRKPLAAYLHEVGARGLILKILTDVFMTENGLATEVQSSLNMLTLIDTKTQDHKIHPLGTSEERYKIRGGNQQLTDRMASAIAARAPVHTQHRLVALRDRSGGGYTLTFETPGRTVDVAADFVVCTIPFSVLRNVVLPASLSARKRAVIEQLGYGTNSKLVAGFKRRLWRTAGRNGQVFADEPFQFCWDSTLGQPGTAGAITFYLGGPRGLEIASGTPASQAQNFLPGFDRVFPGAAAQSTGAAERCVWARQPFTRGSYSVYRVGQWTSIGGAQSTPEGQLYFAGEHCSYEFQGFMNGAVESGRVAAQSLLRRLGRHSVR